MIIVLFVVHVLIALALVGVVMLQKSEGGALGMGGGGMSGFMTGRSTSNLLTRTTAILAALFFATSILLVVLGHPSRTPRSIIDEGPPPPILPATSGAPAAPASPGPATSGPASSGPASSSPASPGPAQPTPPAGPGAPLAK